MLIALWVVSSAASPPVSHAQDLTEHDPPRAQAEAIDSLAVRLLEIDLEQARCEAEAASFWRRLIPSVRLSASLGVSELSFRDEPGAIVLPSDAYRITLSLSLNEIFNPERRRKALLQLERLATQRDILRRRQLAREVAEALQRADLRRTIEENEAELLLYERIARFYQMRFEQGEVEYPLVARAELDLLTLRARLDGLRMGLQARTLPDAERAPITQLHEGSP